MTARRRSGLQDTPPGRLLFGGSPSGDAPGANIQQAPSPLADRMRPAALDELLGQAQLVGDDKPLRVAIEADRLGSILLWGPPGSGKTSLARLIARYSQARFVAYSAVLGTLPELRELLAEAKELRTHDGQRTILFIDEIHRFNKGQQDAFLPHVEQGSIVLVGATTENPSFAVNAALLSRCTVYQLNRLADDVLAGLLARALGDEEHGLGAHGIGADDAALLAIAKHADGDARRALNALEAVSAQLIGRNAEQRVTTQLVATTLARAPLLYDRDGEEHYNVVSALIKSMRGSDPDASIYWVMRMLEAGDDPLFVLRRLLIFASEDVGNADPRALQIVIAADQSFRRMGMPEGIYPVAQAVLYLALAPKSNAVGKAWTAAKKAVHDHGSLAVPLKLRNAVTGVMSAAGYGQDYQYAHDHANHVVAGETYLPEELGSETFFEPGVIGTERQLFDRLVQLRSAQKKGKSEP